MSTPGKSVERLTLLFVLLILVSFFSAAARAAECPSNPMDFYAVIVGVNNSIGETPLEFAADDATDLYDALLKFPNWKIDRMTLLTDFTDIKPTKLNIQTSITSKSNVADENDIFLFYFSGHGGQLKKDYGPLFDESDGKDETISASDGKILDDQLGVILASLRTKKIVVIIEACHSGGQIQAAMYEKATDWFGEDIVNIWKSQVKPMDLSRNSGCFAMTSCTDIERYLEVPNIKNSVFTWFILGAVSKSSESMQYDYNMDGVLSAEEVFRYAGPRTRNLTLHFPYLLDQNPQYYDAYPTDSPATGELPLCVPTLYVEWDFHKYSSWFDPGDPPGDYVVKLSAYHDAAKTLPVSPVALNTPGGACYTSETAEMVLGMSEQQFLDNFLLPGEYQILAQDPSMNEWFCWTTELGENMFPDMPYPIDPPGGYHEGNVTISWTDVPDAQWYDIILGSRDGPYRKEDLTWTTWTFTNVSAGNYSLYINAELCEPSIDQCWASIYWGGITVSPVE